MGDSISFHRTLIKLHFGGGPLLRPKVVTAIACLSSQFAIEFGSINHVDLTSVDLLLERGYNMTSAGKNRHHVSPNIPSRAPYCCT